MTDQAWSSSVERILDSEEGLIAILGEDTGSRVVEKIAREYGIHDHLNYIDESEVSGYETPRVITQGDGIIRGVDKVIGLLDTLAYQKGTTAEEIQETHQKYYDRLTD